MDGPTNSPIWIDATPSAKPTSVLSMGGGGLAKRVARTKCKGLTTQGGQPFTRHYIFSSRSGFSETARHYAASINAQLVDLERLDQVFAQATR